MNLKTILILTMILLSMSMCGCIGEGSNQQEQADWFTFDYINMCVKNNITSFILPDEIAFGSSLMDYDSCEYPCSMTFERIDNDYCLCTINIDSPLSDKVVYQDNNMTIFNEALAHEEMMKLYCESN